jgi:hypothetical protein
MDSSGDCGIPDNRPMPAPPLVPESSRHLLVPFAAASAPECQALLPGLPLPRLTELLALLTEHAPDRGEDEALSPPHERALARALGLPVAGDGRIPWVAAQSDAPTVPQAWFSPCHFQVGMEQVQLLPGSQLDLPEADSRALLDALAPFCAEDGITLRFDSATQWHASGEPLRGIACASLDRVSGRQVDAWMTESPANPAGAQLLKRLQSEAQMLFYTHPVHDARTARGLLPVNGFWVHGAGALDASPALREPPTMPEGLRQAALRADWAGWQAAWQALDAGEIAELLAAVQRGDSVTLTLCGERHARTWTTQPVSALARLTRPFKHLLGRAPASQTLKDL